MTSKNLHPGHPDCPAGAARTSLAVRIGRAAIPLSFLLLAACAAAPSKPTDADPFPERAEARWEALLAGDLETAYSYLSPGYRSTVSIVDWGISQRTRKVNWTSADYVSHDCDEMRCTVIFSAGFTVQAPVPGMDQFDSKQRVEETWIKTEGEWWYLPKK
ncbi:MAG: hypothetical protein KJO33_01180 [Gammaproteobacteria bacterium]|nr:hypothetical protein [Gammaproteobacteria bacterium]